ncbi:cell division protein FtsA [Candidatus Saccharibacteria bacterium RIFCSPHIGHO2_01_FULL_49_21]|nr:MAG: cell division protein FtsA [Candidatus Saccharibacteria bacterium RIFCSPHIGHO2_01_FULL_49_21]OGL37853.1 MAG: cell division protein FtsA [Candidatus Saccharibacteria bacterium RIFCSPLOWO2_01_FULL_49_22]
MSEEKLQYFVGLDIGTTATRCVVGELAADVTLPTIIGFSSAANSGMRKGNVAHVEEVAASIVEAVGEAERMSGREIKTATVNVNGSHVQGINSKGVIAISSPNRVITDDDRQRVDEAATIVQLPPNKQIIQVFAKNYRLDGQENIKDPLGMHGVRLEVDTHIVVASTPALKSLEQVFDRAQLHPAHRTVTSLAAAEAILDRKQRDSGVAVLDIGAATTNMVVIEDGEVEHVAVIPMGGTHITNDLAIGLKSDLDVAELVKLKHASLNPVGKGELSFVKDGETLRFDKEMMRIIVEARVEEILEFVDKELKSIRRSRKLPGGVVFTGGTAKLPGLVDCAKEVLELPARVGQWGHINKVVDGLDEQIYAPAVGLMLLDMLLGPAERHTFSENQPGILQSVNVSINSLIGRFRRR